MRKTLRFRLALLAGKLAMFAQRLLGMNASYFPGNLALKLCPDFCGMIDKPAKIIAVTGTNGKTTCCNMALGILEDNGYDVLNNKLGSNINAGIASSLISGSTMGGKAKKNLAVFEVDERSSRIIYKYVQPDFLLCTNLFRDSIRRNAHPEYIFNFVDSAIPEKTKLILNGDDIISSRLASGNPRVYFGIAPMATDLDHCENIVNDMSTCPQCHEKLHYNYVRYHHIGSAFCPQCGFASPAPDYSGQVDIPNMQLTMAETDGQYTYPLINSSIFNIYNEVGVITLLREVGLTAEQISGSILKTGIVQSRYSNFTEGGITVVTNMAKSLNPVACSCVFDYVRNEPGTKEVVLILNDMNDAKVTSENVTWMYDTDFQFLNSPEIKRIIIGGVRSEDIKLRLLIGGMPEDKIIITEKEIDTGALLALDCEGVYILHDLTLNDVAMTLKETVRARISEKEAV